MANTFDYIYWRGDIDFAVAPFNPVDALILCRLSYIPFDGIVGDLDKAPVPLSLAAKTCLELVKSGERAFRMDDDMRLLDALISAPRFCDMLLCGYVNRFDKEAEKQFSAITALTGDAARFVAFRGTDGTLVGWKEDFNICFQTAVPAQLDAVEYLEASAACDERPIRVGGHSKGGNLAVYASASCSQGVKARISAIYNNDGPGFNSQTLEKKDFLSVIPRVHTFVPQSSVIGMLLQHEEDFTIVHSENMGILQHDLYSWHITPNSFVFDETTTNSSQFIDMALKDWLTGMTSEFRGKFIDGVYAILASSDATTLGELVSGKSAIAIIKAMKNTDEETKEMLSEAFRILRQSMKKALPVQLEKIHKRYVEARAAESSRVGAAESRRVFVRKPRELAMNQAGDK